MVRHIVLWSYKKELTDEQRREAGSRIRELLEAVAPLVPGTRSLRVVTEGLPSGSRDVALLSEFESREALEAYQVHPAHLKAKEYVGSVTCGRACMDFRE